MHSAPLYELARRPLPDKEPMRMEHLTNLIQAFNIAGEDNADKIYNLGTLFMCGQKITAGNNGSWCVKQDDDFPCNRDYGFICYNIANTLGNEFAAHSLLITPRTPRTQYLSMGSTTHTPNPIESGSAFSWVTSLFGNRHSSSLQRTESSRSFR